METRKLTVFFSCAVCGATNVECKIRAREREEDLIKWLNKLKTAIALRHQVVSFLCEATTITQVYIPTSSDKNAWIGKYVKNPVPPP